MTTHSVMYQTGRVRTEGDELFYEVRKMPEASNGAPVLLMIAPGGGDGWQYSWVAELLADEFKVITYDRRANGRSTMNDPVNFEISQQSRDALAVLHAAGEQTAFVFGNSSGAVIALELARTCPEAVRAVVVHEAPIPRVLPNARKWQAFFAGVYSLALHVSPSLAALRFMLGTQLPVGQLIRATRGINEHRAQSSETYLSDRAATEVLVKHELLPVTNYLPDTERIKANGVKVFVAVGQWGVNRNAWYVQAARILARELNCELVTFPGHHGSFMDMPGEWAVELREVVKRASE